MDQPSDAIVALEPAVRRIALLRLDDPEDVDDVVQETLTRLIEARDRLELATLGSYAVVTARNLAVSLGREGDVAKRHAARLVDPRSPADPEELALRREERAAVVAALAQLRHEEAMALVRHDALGVSTTEIAAEQGDTPGAVATRLARARARLRVEYVLSFLRRAPVTPLCRPVLYSIASGDRRRQRALGASEHVATCEVCSEAVRPLVEKRRSLAVIAPFLAAGRWVRRTPRAHPAASAAAGAAAAAVIATTLFTGPTPAPETGSPRRALLTIGDETALPLPDDFAWQDHAGDKAVGRRAPVLAVPTDEGFWVGTGRSDRLWVALEGLGESPVRITRQSRVSFTGRLVANTQAFLRSLDLTPASKTLLRQQGFHIAIPANDVTVSGS